MRMDPQIAIGTIASLLILLAMVFGAFMVGRAIGRQQGFDDCSGKPRRWWS